MADNMDDGKVCIALVSGGIDSPVAVARMLAAGWKIHPVHCSQEPITGPEAEEKTISSLLHLMQLENSIGESARENLSKELVVVPVAEALGKFTEPVAKDAISGLSFNIEPLSLFSLPLPPVENWIIIPGQCFFIPVWNFSNNLGSEDGFWNLSLTWTWTIVAPASKASCVDSICSVTVTGTAGLSDFFGTEPVIATVIIHGVVIINLFLESTLKLKIVVHNK